MGTERTLEKCAFRGYMGKETPAGWEVGGPGCPPDLTQSAHRKSLRALRFVWVLLW